LHAGKGMELKIIMSSKIIQTHKDKYCMFSITYEMKVKGGLIGIWKAKRGGGKGDKRE
jgi:hypothetical protein